MHNTRAAASAATTQSLFDLVQLLYNFLRSFVLFSARLPLRLGARRYVQPTATKVPRAVFFSRSVSRQAPTQTSHGYRNHTTAPTEDRQRGTPWNTPAGDYRRHPEPARAGRGPLAAMATPRCLMRQLAGSWREAQWSRALHLARSNAAREAVAAAPGSIACSRGPLLMSSLQRRHMSTTRTRTATSAAACRSNGRPTSWAQGTGLRGAHTARPGCVGLWSR